MRISTLALAFLCFVRHAAAFQGTTWVVDPTGATGQFTQLDAAIAAATDGDKIVVTGGTYGNTTVDKGVTIVGAPTRFNVGILTVSGIVGADVATVCNVKASRIEISNNTGTVIVTDSEAYYLTPWLESSATAPAMFISSTRDARMHGTLVHRTGWGSASGGDGIWCSASRVEMRKCRSDGGLAKSGHSSTGIYCYDGLGPCNAPDGGNGLVCGDSSRLHLVASIFRGGDGADERILHDGGVGGGFIADATSGGTGIVCSNAITVAVDSKIGLRGGGSAYNGPPPAQGWGVEGAIFRQTGSRLRVAPGVVAPAALPRDPMLELIGTPTPGSSVTLRVKGKAGLRLRFEEGAPVIIDDGLNEIEQLTTAINILPAGNIPLGGLLSYVWSIPATATIGDMSVIQGVQTDPATGAVIGRTNSVVLVVR